MPNTPTPAARKAAADTAPGAAAQAAARRNARRVAVTLPALACFLFLMAVAMPLSYLGGVMIGREYPAREKTETELLAEAVRADGAARAQADAGAGNDETAGNPGEALTPPAAGDGGEGAREPASRILRPQELGFARLLHMPPGEKEIAQTRPLAPAVDRRARQEAQAAMPEMLPGMSPAVAEGPPQPPAQKAETYDFVFQVAAYRGSAAADNARRQLEARGYRTRVEKSGRLVLVLVLARGPESKAAEVREDMLGMNMGAPIERSRKPVFRPSGR